MPSKLTVIAVRLTKVEKSAVEKAAKEDGRSAASWVRMVLRDALKKGK